MWARNDSSRRSQIYTWLDEAVVAISDNKGAQLVSSSGNGMSVTFANDLTHTEWLAALTTAIELLDQGSASSTTVAVVR